MTFSVISIFKSLALPSLALDFLVLLLPAIVSVERLDAASMLAITLFQIYNTIMTHNDYVHRLGHTYLKRARWLSNEKNAIVCSFCC